jgi:glycosyltransferase involved in cell wall biosynthesis
MKLKRRDVMILLPVCNGAGTIGRTAKSIADQTFDRDRVYTRLIDNGSRDDSVGAFQSAIIAHPECNSIEWMWTPEAEPGIVPALNRGLFQYVKDFDYVARIDADDIWYPEKLEKQIAFLEANPDIHIVGTQIRQVDKNGDPLPNQFRYPTDDKTIKEWLLAGRNPIAHPSVVFRRDIVLRTGGYDNTYPIAEDYHLWLKAMPWYNFANLDEVLVDYTVAHNPKYNPLSPQLACMAAKAAIRL